MWVILESLSGLLSDGTQRNNAFGGTLRWQIW
jgi:hypothetical protein